MRAAINRFMSLFGYVPRAEAAADIGVLLALLGPTLAPAAEQSTTAELAADETQPLILAELRKQTTLLVAKQGDQVMRGAAISADVLHVGAVASSASSPAARIATMAAFADMAPAVTAAAEKRFAVDPFAPTFELDAGAGAVAVTLYPRPGSVQYLVNVTGPHSPAVKFEGALPKLVQVSAVVESPR